MHGEMTPAVERALQAAQDWARRLDRPTAGPVTLLLGLLDEDEGYVAEQFERHGLALDTARKVLQGLPAGADAGSIDTLIGEAGQLARHLAGERTPLTQHVLLAIVRSSSNVRDELLRAGLDVVAIESVAGKKEPFLTPLDEPLDFVESPETMEAARILDASANRAREALRVVEDYCRFALDDEFLSRECKIMRHDLTEALLSAGRLPLLAARDTEGDVGTTISTMSEGQRESLLEVVRTNLKRLQEALRSLEEYGKIFRPELGAAMEQLRYASYTLERAILLGQNSRQRLANARLYLLVTGSACAASLEFVVAEAAAGGVDVVQLREKDLGYRDLLQRARQVRQWTRDAGVLFIVNDRPDIARLAEADGVHLGQDDLPVRDARRIVGPDALIGVSTHSVEQLQQAIRDGASYVGIGPVFPSRTKQFEELAGLEYVRQAMGETSLPAFALGGITLENAPQVLAAGAKRLAVSSAICGADEPRPVARALRAILDASHI
jgi:thiamine-phosphate pyrophosphorylase